MYEETPWLKNDHEGKYLWIFETFRKYFKLMHRMGLQLISLLAEGLGKRPDYFEPWFKEECSSAYRFIHYLPRCHDRAAAYSQLREEDRILVTPEHADSGFITMLSTFGFPGLEVEIEGEYRAIKPVKNGVVVNLGETLSKISGGRIKATRHRVRDIGAERYSCPFFLDPKFSALISSDILESKREYCEDKEFDKQAKEDGKQIAQLLPHGKILLKKMTKAYGEWKGFKIPEGMEI